MNYVVIGRGAQGSVWSELLKCPIFPGRELPETLPTDTHFILATPDHTHHEVAEKIRARTQPKGWVVLTGYSVWQKSLLPKGEEEILMVAPKAIAPKLLENSLAGRGFFCVIDTLPSNPEAKERAEFLALKLGSRPEQLIHASFSQEATADLLSEQTILCRWLPELLEKTHKFLVDKGIDPRLAWIESTFEAKLILEVIIEKGISGLWQKISPLAAVGAATNNNGFDLEKTWERIVNGEFQKTFDQEIKTGLPLTKSFQKGFSSVDAGRLSP